MNTLRSGLLSLLWLGCVSLLSASAQTKRPLTVEDIVAVNRASDVQLAADGRRVAFVVTSWDRAADRFNTDLWTATADVGGSAQQLTFHARRDEQPPWASANWRCGLWRRPSACAKKEWFG